MTFCVFWKATGGRSSPKWIHRDRCARGDRKKEDRGERHRLVRDDRFTVKGSVTSEMRPWEMVQIFGTTSESNLADGAATGAAPEACREALR